jgi:hypothetical protein
MQEPISLQLCMGIWSFRAVPVAHSDEMYIVTRGVPWRGVSRRHALVTRRLVCAVRMACVAKAKHQAQPAWPLTCALFLAVGVSCREHAGRGRLPWARGARGGRVAVAAAAAAWPPGACLAVRWRLAA